MHRRSVVDQKCGRRLGGEPLFETAKGIEIALLACGILGLSVACSSEKSACAPFAGP